MSPPFGPLVCTPLRNLERKEDKKISQAEMIITEKTKAKQVCLNLSGRFKERPGHHSSASISQQIFLLKFILLFLNFAFYAYVFIFKKKFNKVNRVFKKDNMYF